MDEAYEKISAISNIKKGLVIIKKVLIIPIVISLYEICFSKNYELKYTYWVFLISFIGVSIIYHIMPLIGEHERRKSIKKKQSTVRLWVIMILSILTTDIPVYYQIDKVIQPQKQIILEEVKVPEYISVYKYEKSAFGFRTIGLGMITTINNDEDINKIVNDLQSKKLKI